MGAPSKIDRLIELGLNRYGAGDLDGALLMWEEALAIDPDNAQALSYVDYVRLHYETLSSGQPEVTQGDDVPFGIHEEPEYQIEISPGELPTRESLPEIANDAIDAGWFDDEATHSLQQTQRDAESDVEATHAQLRTVDDEPAELELEAEEPPEMDTPMSPASDSVPESFDDATHEYRSARMQVPTPSELADPANEFQTDEHSGGFSSEGTPVGFSFQETEIRKRDLGFVQPIGGTDPGDQTQERGAFGGDTDEGHDDLGEDMMSSLTMPQTDSDDVVTVRGGKVAITKDLPEPRPPARRDSADLSQAEVMLNHAPTQDFNPAKLIDIAAPTRDLGMRTVKSLLTNPDDEEVPTKQSDVRAIRETAARDDGRATQQSLEGTKHDIMLQFDPIEARTAEILEDIDADAPTQEDEGERTRRRIGALLDKATTYNAMGDVERAVTAVDLALSEDPDSALGQKLITRNRDTIMSIFQSFIGDLERMPQLAKPLHELQDAPISPRAAFLLSRIDGTLTVDELLDVSGMPRMEAYRHLCQLMLRGILR